jgi:hypothetical protein
LQDRTRQRNHSSSSASSTSSRERSKHSKKKKKKKNRKKEKGKSSDSDSHSRSRSPSQSPSPPPPRRPPNFDGSMSGDEYGSEADQGGRRQDSGRKSNRPETVTLDDIEAGYESVSSNGIQDGTTNCRSNETGDDSDSVQEELSPSILQSQNCNVFTELTKEQLMNLHVVLPEEIC